VPPRTETGKWTLGNLLLDQLEDGTILAVHGEGQTQCYCIEFEVHAESRDSGYENDDGPRPLAILVCSGQPCDLSWP
jgi:hypothetical protein